MVAGVDYRLNETRSIVIVVSIVTMVLHIGLCIAILKARLKQNQYLLIQLLSINDAVFAFFTPVVLICFTISKKNNMVANTIWQVSSVLVTASGIQSFSITALLSIDRLIAVVLPFRYRSLVTKTRILGVASLLGFLNLSVVLILFETTEEKEDVIKSTRAVQIQQLVNRFIVIVLLLVIGAIIKHIRNKSETRIRSVTQTTGAPKMTSLKQSVKDILVLNWWTVFFVVPRLFTLSIMTSRNVTEELRTVDVAFVTLYVISNPFVYAFTQSLLRKKLKNWFCRKNTS